MAILFCCCQKRGEDSEVEDAASAEGASAALSIETSDGKRVAADNCVFMCGFCEQIFSTSELVNEHILQHNINENGELVGDDGSEVKVTAGGSKHADVASTSGDDTKPPNPPITIVSRPVEPPGSPVTVDMDEISPEELAVLEQGASYSP